MEQRKSKCLLALTGAFTSKDDSDLLLCLVLPMYYKQGWTCATPQLFLAGEKSSLLLEVMSRGLEKGKTCSRFRVLPDQAVRAGAMPQISSGLAGKRYGVAHVQPFW